MSTSRFVHLRADSLERYSFGQLAGLSLKRAEEHLLVCSECRDQLDALETLLTSIRAVHQPQTMTVGSLSFT